LSDFLIGLSPRDERLAKLIPNRFLCAGHI
jgi:hypothetical protein